MREYTVEQRKAYARSLNTKELLELADQYKNPTPWTMEEVISKILDAEVERRIANWEVAEV
jgi:hypothetical protein